jgi:two-component sensor histidine kinase
MANLSDLLREYGGYELPFGPPVSLSEGSTDSRRAAHLQSLVGDWQLVADLSFADLLLWVPDRRIEGLVCVAQVRPVTGATSHHEDQIGRRTDPVGRYAVETAWREGRIVRDSDPIWLAGVPVRTEGIPIRLAGDVIAVVGRDTNVAAGRVPSQLELAYLRMATDLVRMMSEGSFPFSVDDEFADDPRVGDGLLRLDAAGVVTFASPNALSAYRKLGLAGNIVGTRLRDVHDQLELHGSPVWRVLATHRPERGEVAANGAEVLLRGLPLRPGGELLGALVLLRDVTDLRHRERALLSKDATIREIHHRVKNNLQTVAALLRLQGRRTEAVEAKEALAEAVRRVTSIALVHETLSQTLNEDVEFDGICDQMATTVLELAATGERVARVRRVGSFGTVPGEVATALALVLSELLQNAVEHAYAGNGGELELRITRSSAGIEVIVADDGAGLPVEFDLESSTRLGLQIVRSLVVGELRGTIVLRPRLPNGTEAVVTVPASRLQTHPMQAG